MIHEAILRVAARLRELLARLEEPEHLREIDEAERVARAGLANTESSKSSTPQTLPYTERSATKAADKFPAEKGKVTL